MAFERTAEPIIQSRCLICHNGSNPHIPNLTGYDNVKKMTLLNTGTPIQQLVLLSHIHLIGLTLVFFAVGLIFSHAYVRPVWFKCAVIVAPFVAIVTDISSWYLTKLIRSPGW